MSDEGERKRYRRARNRKRSGRRAIYCPVHGCYLDSASQKYPLYADSAEQLQRRGMSKRKSRTVISSHKAVSLPGEWLEAFWCKDCQSRIWYHVCRDSTGKYAVSLAPRELWQQVSGVKSDRGNPSVGEFTLQQARACYGFT